MLWLVVGLILWIAVHLSPSLLPSIRAGLVGSIGEKPYKGGTAMGIIYKHAQAPIPLLPPRLSEYQALINMMLAKMPEDRLQTVAEIKEWL